jgi:transposase
VRKIEIDRDRLEHLFIGERKTYDQIAKIFGCSPAVVSRRIKQFGIRKCDKRNDEIGAIREMYDGGMSIKEIAKKTRYSFSEIHRRLCESGIKEFDRSSVKIPKEKLKELHIKKKMSMSDIAQMFGCCASTVRYKLDKYNIPVIESDRLRHDIDCDELRRLYIDGRMTIKGVAGHYGVGVNTIKDRLLRYGVGIKSKKRIKQEAAENHVELSDEFRQVIDGELLGDGSLRRLSVGASFAYGTANLEYATYLFELFKRNKISMVGDKIRKRVMIPTSGSFAKNGPATSYSFVAKSNYEFGEIYDRWYPDDVKIVPHDLELTPIVVLHWYIGDGTTNGRSITLCTDSFTLEENQLLSTLLYEAVGIEPKVRECVLCSCPGKYRFRKYYRLYIRRLDAKKFLEYIGQCPVKSYKYKWNYKEVVEPDKVGIFPEVREDITIGRVMKMLDGGMTQKQIAAELKCNVKTVRTRICRAREMQK